MKKVCSSLAMLIIFATSFAQNISGKLLLKKGDIIKSTSDMNMTMMQSMMGGEPMEMKTVVNSYTEIEVKEVLENAYVVTETLKKMKMDFDGFGQKMKYDSESKEKQDNPFVKQIAEQINKPEEFQIGFDGKVIESAKKKDDKKESKGMMKMSNMSGNPTVENAFLIIPKEAIANGGWETTTEKEGLTTRRKYTLGAVMGEMANVTVQCQTKGEIETNRGGMSMTNKVNNTSEEMIMVNTTTGKVQMQTIEMNSNGKTIMNDTESPTTGKTSITSMFE